MSDVKTNYKSVGMHIEESDAFADWIGHTTPRSKLVLDGVGGFASICRLPFEKYEKPCLVTCTDGVGTKVLIASELGDVSTVGQDLVAMCVNDLICTGGDPYFFLDYYAVGKFEKIAAQWFLASVQKACAESGCDLVGGETAEMPGVYQGNHFDCAGFAIGLVDEKKRWGAHKVQAGDVLVGLASSGFHSNGFSLIRKVFDKEWDKYKKWLLEPTKLYVKPVQKLRELVDVHAAANITGGGLDNVPRVLPKGMVAKIDQWKLPDCFVEVQKRTGMSWQEMVTTLNCGLGFVVVVSSNEQEKVIDWGHQFNLNPWVLGTVEKASNSNAEASWEKRS